ncbi:lipopolysaccharide-induced tumor necrosis factor-alpha factor homolog [Leuresthes tenuis]|uniref:lipopolysaccharide-induced tumor necrosis factor-alpha factor homolog n=1 Tax=Leuresthes tenuis TaxID=355514 RepID=UPI003B5122BA
MEPSLFDETSCQIDLSPPPDYNNSMLSPSTPPPAYGDVVQQDLFPVLTPPSVPVEIPPTQSSVVTVHPITQIGSSRGQTQTVAVVSQPHPVPINIQFLRDTPGYVRCTQCQHFVTSKVTYVAGGAAWCTCALLALMGLICGFCLIPLVVPSLQDVHHSCPRCENQLYVYKR